MRSRLSIFLFFKLFQNTCCLEGVVGTILLDSAHTLGRNSKDEGLINLRYVYALLLKVSVLAVVAGWGKNSRTSAVGVLAAYLRSLFSYHAFFCHMFAHGTIEA